MSQTQSKGGLWPLADVMGRRLSQLLDTVGAPMVRGAQRNSRVGRRSADKLVQIDVTLYQVTGRASRLLAQHFVDQLRALRLMPTHPQLPATETASQPTQIVVDLTDPAPSPDLLPVG